MTQTSAVLFCSSTPIKPYLIGKIINNGPNMVFFDSFVQIVFAELISYKECLCFPTADNPLYAWDDTIEGRLYIDRDVLMFFVRVYLY